MDLSLNQAPTNLDEDHSPKNELEDIKEAEENENEEIRNFIHTMNKEDVEKLRQSLIGTFSQEEVEKVRQSEDHDAIEDSLEIRGIPKKSDPAEIDEEIVENIGSEDEEIHQAEEMSYKTDAAFRNNNVSKYPSTTGKHIKVLKPRPISATHDQMKSSRTFDVGLGLSHDKSIDLRRPIETPKTEANTTMDEFGFPKKINTNPFKKPFSTLASEPDYTRPTNETTINTEPVSLQRNKKKEELVNF